MGCLSLLTGLSASAAPASFREDLGYLRQALEVGRFSDAGLDSYLDPRLGEAEFRLSEQRAPWAGNYFPMAKGGIAQRWQALPKTRKTMDPNQKPDEARVKAMSQDEINRLSPAEKFDLLQNNYDFSLTEQELYRRGPLRDYKPADWEGFCNGVRCAGILLPEPEKSITVRNHTGIEITFQPADLKALAGASYFYVEKYAQLGGPSREGKAEAQPNAAAFDMALRYYLGVKQKAFVIDSHQGSEIWNESVIGFKRELSPNRNLTKEEKAAYPKAVSKIYVKMTLETLGETKIEDSNRTTKAEVAEGRMHKTVKGAYTLYLNKHGELIDGRWTKARSNRGVDFVWFGGGRGTDADYSRGVGNEYLDFDVLKKLFKQSIGNSCQGVYL